MKLRRLEEAVESYDRAVALRPGYTDALNNRGSALMELGRIHDALADLAAVIALDPGHPGARWNRALCNLLLGRYREAWPDYERRIQAGLVHLHWQDCGRLQWDGGDIAGKTLLLHSEQGFGDTIMAARYLPWVAAKGAHVVVEVPPALASLMEPIEGIRVVTPDHTVPAFDLHCPMMSLPGVSGTMLDTIPADVPYLRAPPAHLEKWQHRLRRGGARRVGIAWAGNAVHKRDDTRSIELAAMAPLLACPGVELYGLQKDLRPGDAELLQRQPRITNLGADIESLADTGAIVAHLDLVISVDTSTVHLAGALGRPVWVLVQFAPDWRWLLDREDSPWYPTARLFRQERLDEWSKVIEKVAAELSHFAVGRERGDCGTRASW